MTSRPRSGHVPGARRVDQPGRHRGGTGRYTRSPWPRQRRAV